MAYIPFIEDYKPFYIQTANDTTAWGTEVYGLVAKSNPYPILPNPKEAYKNDWFDENGDDEYVASQCFKSQEISVKFFCKVPEGDTSAKILREQMSGFFEKIKYGEFSIYDSYTGVGRRKVRYEGYDEDSFFANDGCAIAEFSVKFKVNDPVTIMRYNAVSRTIAPASSLSVSDVDIPFICNYHPFYIQVESDSQAWDTRDYGLVAKSNPYPILPNAKEPFGIDSNGEDGAQEFVSYQFYKAYEIGVKFYCRAKNEVSLRNNINAFFEKIRNGEFLIYDSYTGLGREKVRYAGYEGESFISRNGFARAIFTIKLKVNNPVTFMYYDESTHTIVYDPVIGRDDLLGTETGGKYVVTENGFYIQVA